MEVAIPHSLGKDTVRVRPRTRGHLIGENIPGGMAEVTTQWPSEDRMAMAINAMGQSLNAHVDIEDERVMFYVEQPPALRFIQPIDEGAIRKQGQALLAPPTG